VRGWSREWGEEGIWSGRQSRCTVAYGLWVAFFLRAWGSVVRRREAAPSRSGVFLTSARPMRCRPRCRVQCLEHELSHERYEAPSSNTHTHAGEGVAHTTISFWVGAAPPRAGCGSRHAVQRSLNSTFSQGTYGLYVYPERVQPPPRPRSRYSRPGPAGAFPFGFAKTRVQHEQQKHFCARPVSSSPWRLRPSLFCRAWYALEDLRCCGRTHNLPPSMYLSLSLRA
jgi:hypothetical protein